MVVEIDFDDRRFQLMIARAPGVIAKNFRKILGEAGRGYRDQVRENIRTEGTTFGRKWAKPSKWIMAKKNVRKSLSGQEKNMHYRIVGESKVEVYFDSPGSWSIDQHHQGFIKPAEGGRVFLKLKRPSALTRKPNGGGPYRGSTFSFHAERKSVVPARRIWPTKTQGRAIIQPFARKFALAVKRELT